MITHKGYVAEVEFDHSVNVFHARVANIDDVVTFEGDSVEALERAFRDSVDDYLDWCAELKQAPARPYAGSVEVALDTRLYKRAIQAAHREGKTLSGFIGDCLASSLSTSRPEPRSARAAKTASGPRTVRKMTTKSAARQVGA